MSDLNSCELLQGDTLGANFRKVLVHLTSVFFQPSLDKSVICKPMLAVLLMGRHLLVLRTRSCMF